MADKKIVIDITLDKTDAGKKLAQTEKELAQLRKTQAELNKKIKEGNELTEEENLLLEQVVKNLDKETKARNQILKSIKNEENSINALRAEISRLNEERNNLNTGTEEGAKRFEELTTQLKEYNEQVNDASKQAGSFRDNIGNYTESVKDALNQTNIFGVSVEELKGFFDTVKLGILENVKSLNFLKIAIIATGIGALVIALGALITFLTQTEKGSEKVSQIFAQLGKLIQPLISGLAKVGELVFGLIEGVIDLGVAFVDLFGDTGANQAKAYASQLQQIDKDLQQIEADSSAILAKEEELKNIRDNENLSDEKRIKANEKLGKIELQRLNTLLTKEQEKLKILKAQFERTAENLRTEEQGTAIAEQTKKVNELIRDSLGKQNEQIKNAVALSKKRFENEQRLRDAQLENEILTGKVAQNSAKALESQIDAIKRRRDEEIKAQKSNVKDTEVNLTVLKSLETEAENEILKLKKDFYDQQKEAYQNLLDSQKDARAKALQNELDTINAQILYQKDGSTQRLELLEQSFLKEAEIRRLNEDTEVLINAETQQKIRESRQAFFGEIKTLQNGYNNFVIETTAKTNEALVGLDKRSANARIENDIALLEHKKQVKQAEIELEIRTATATASILGALAQIAGQNTAVGKVLSIAQATVDTYAAGVAILKNTALSPAGQIPGFAIAQLAITIGAGLATVAKIAGVDIPDISGSLSTISSAIGTIGQASQGVPKFASGGLVVGAGTSKSDSIPSLLSNGESVMTAKATEMFMPYLSAMNVAGGGVPFVSKFASGGIATTPNINQIDSLLNPMDLIRAFTNAPAPVVSVTDINKAQSRKKTKVNLGSLA